MTTTEVFFIDKKITFTYTPLSQQEEKHTTEIIFSNLYQLIFLFEKHFINSKSKNNVSVLLQKKFNVDEVFSQFINCFEVVHASGGLVHTPKDKYLYIYRNGRWDLPKGHREKREKKETTALREVLEETGISDVSIIKQLPSTYHFYTEDNEFKIKETHWYEMLTPAVTPTTPQIEEGIEKAVFLSKKEVIGKLPLMWGSIASLTKQVLENS
jgi:8-oxo-dGTP pyrophosphatase MutT (NUDIX family)